MDNDTPWPEPLVEDRADVRRPKSLGVTVMLPDEAAGAEFVIYAGGWADAIAIARDGVVLDEYVEMESASEFGSLLDRVVERL